jgi:hypothetical protein
VQQHDRVALSDFHVRHLTAEDTPPLFWVWKCCRDYVDWFFFEGSHAVVDARRLPKAEPSSPAISRRLRGFAMKEMSSLLGGQPMNTGDGKEDDNPTLTDSRLAFGHEEKAWKG